VLLRPTISDILVKGVFNKIILEVADFLFCGEDVNFTEILPVQKKDNIDGNDVEGYARPYIEHQNFETGPSKSKYDVKGEPEEVAYTEYE